MFLFELILRVFGLKKDSDFKYEQGANLFVFLIRIFLIGGVLVFVFGDLSVFSRLLPKNTQTKLPPQTVYVAPQPQQPVYPALPLGVTTYDDGHWYELCWQNQTQCTIGQYYSEPTENFHKRDGSHIDSATVVAYNMITAPARDLVSQYEYTICEMDESVVWIKNPDDQFAVELTGCIHVRFEKIQGDYYWFTNMDTNEILISPFVSYNVFPFVYPVVP